MKGISYRQASRLIKKMDQVLILMHENPDMDSIGAAYALALYFFGKNKTAWVGIEKPIFERFSFFFEKGHLEKFFLLNEQIEKSNIKWIICVDTATPKLLGSFEHIIKYHKVLAVDHHKVFVPYGTWFLNHPEKSSASEMILDILGTKKINNKIAQSLYAGMIYDTGNFRYDSTTPELLRKAAELLEKFKIKTDELAFYLFENESLERKKMTAQIVNTIESFENHELTVSYFYKKFKENLNIEDSETTGLVHIGQSLKGNVFSILVKEGENEVSVSFRCRSSFDVSALAQKWGGGGHQKASGLKLKNMNIEEFKKNILPICIEEYHQWRMNQQRG